MKTRILFICTANEQRSPTAEELINSSLRLNKKYEAKSAGTHPLADKPITLQAMNWAGIIACMEEAHKSYLVKNFPEIKNKIIVLKIQDVYQKNDPKLIKILKQKINDL